MYTKAILTQEDLFADSKSVSANKLTLRDFNLTEFEFELLEEVDEIIYQPDLETGFILKTKL